MKSHPILLSLILWLSIFVADAVGVHSYFPAQPTVEFSLSTEETAPTFSVTEEMYYVD